MSSRIFLRGRVSERLSPLFIINFKINLPMTESEISIDKGQRLSDIMDEISSNTILHKTVCGVGATTLEIHTARHSIIIEPNVPVIKGKEKKHDFILGVYEGVSRKAIEKYLYETDGYHKIMTTPESFQKVKRAMDRTNTNMYKKYFLLFDECEKTIQDIDYRRTVTLPVNDFFKFDNKAMVSATPIMPSDPRFEEQHFTIEKVTPTYNYRRDIEVIQTNNVMPLFKSTVTDISSDDTVCVFYNSTNGIEDIVEKTGIKSETSVFCGTESMEKLKSHGFENVSDTLTIEDGHAKLDRYSFFTSRFYSAVECQPVVIMLTEVYSAPHTMIDPETESIQIAGRFRNGIKRFIHITNSNKDIEYMSGEAMEEYLKSQHGAYTEIRGQYIKTGEQGATDLYRQALKSVSYARFVNDLGEVNHFMYDNAIREELVKSHYQQVSSIREAYRDTKAFNVKYRYTKVALSDKDCKKLEKPISSEKANKMMFRLIDKLAKDKGQKYNQILFDQMKGSCELISRAYRVLGAIKIREIGFSDGELRKAVSEKELSDLERSKGVIAAVYNEFNEGQWYRKPEINSKLMDIYKKFKIHYNKRGIASNICLYYSADEKTRKGKEGYLLGEKIF